MDKFKIRSYGKGELAKLYCPHLSESAALGTLMRWMERQPMLMEQLHEAGFNHHIRILSPYMVRLIVDALGEP